MRKSAGKDLSANDWAAPIPLKDLKITQDDVNSSKLLSVLSILVVITRIVGILQLAVLMYMALYPCAGKMETLEALLNGDFCKLVVGVYASFFSGCIMLVDTEWGFMKGVNAMLESYFVRGSFLLFCGSLQLLIVENCGASGSSSAGSDSSSAGADMSEKVLDIANVIAIAMNALGVIYIVFAFCCVKSITEQSLANIRKKKQALLQEKKLRQHKSEVELLLLETEKKVQKL